MKKGFPAGESLFWGWNRPRPRRRAFRGGDLHEAKNAHQGGARGREFARDGAQGTPPARCRRRALWLLRGARDLHGLKEFAPGPCRPRTAQGPVRQKGETAGKARFRRKALSPRGRSTVKFTPQRRRGLRLRPVKCPRGQASTRHRGQSTRIFPGSASQLSLSRGTRQFCTNGFGGSTVQKRLAIFADRQPF